MAITREAFVMATGREPEHDDLERCNCLRAGTVGHMCCGWNDYRDKPQFEVGPRLRPTTPPAQSGYLRTIGRLCGRDAIDNLDG